MSALEAIARRRAIQIHVYFTLLIVKILNKIIKEARVNVGFTISNLQNDNHLQSLECRRVFFIRADQFFMFNIVIVKHT